MVFDGEELTVAALKEVRAAVLARRRRD